MGFRDEFADAVNADLDTVFGDDETTWTYLDASGTEVESCEAHEVLEDVNKDLEAKYAKEFTLTVTRTDESPFSAEPSVRGTVKRTVGSTTETFAIREVKGWPGPLVRLAVIRTHRTQITGEPD